MANPVKVLGGSLPDDRHNGLFDPKVINDLLGAPRSAVLVVAIVANFRTETNNETGSVIPVLKFHHIEVAGDGPLRSQAAHILHQLHEQRTGEMMLPFEPGEDIPAPSEEQTGDGQEEGTA
jgi:hypothetical protein